MAEDSNKLKRLTANKMDRKMTAKPYQHEVTINNILCDICGAQYTHREAFRRHRRTAHPVNDTLKPWNCWICEKQFKRKDLYNKHNSTLKHQIKLEQYLLPAEERERFMNLRVDEVPVEKTYKPTDINSLTTYTRPIPLERTTDKVKDPRKPTASKPTKYKLKLKLNDIESTSHTDYKNDREGTPALRTEPIIIPLETNTNLVDPRKKTFMELLMSDMSASDILQDMNLAEKQETETTTYSTINFEEVYKELELQMQPHFDKQRKQQEFEELLSQQTFFDPPLYEEPEDNFDELKELSACRTECTTKVTATDEMITLSIDEIDTTDAWLTLDECGITAQENELLPPATIDF
jgi:hypothetical protein